MTYLRYTLYITLLTMLNSSIVYPAKTKHPLKILFVLTYFPESVSTAILNQITGLIDRGHEVVIYTKKIGDLEHAHPDINHYNLIDQTYFHTRRLNNLPPDLGTFDIICCQFGYRAVEFIEVYRDKNLKAKFVTCFRGSDLSKHIKENSKKYSQLFVTGDLFLPVCNFFRERLISLGCDPKKIIVQHSAVDCKKFSFRARTLQPNATIQIITVARLTEKKGLEYAIKAIKKLSQKFPNIEYKIVGTGPLKEKLEQFVTKLNMQEKIKLLGWASQDKVAALLNEAHIFIHPSITDQKGSQEGIPNALKEAMAQGLPVIGTFHAGIPELIENGVSGLLVPEKNAPALAKKIAFLIKNPDLWKNMGIAARKKIKNKFSRERTNDALVEIFQNLLKKGKREKPRNKENKYLFSYAWLSIN